MNKNSLIISFALLFISISSIAQFDRFFENKSLRMDYIHAGDADTEEIFFDDLRIEPYWGGSMTRMTDPFKYGKYFFKVFDVKTDSLIYSRGYCTLFGEWQTTNEAKKIKRAFSESVLCPLPKNDARLELYSRNKKGIFDKIFTYHFSKDNYFANPELKKQYATFDLHISGSPDKNVDILILPEAYTAEEMGIFINDCKTFTRHLFSFEPYTQNKDHFNIRAVLAPSVDSGNDIPADSIWNNSILNTTYYTFDSERYCMTFDNKALRDLAANAPYDQIYILVNSNKYGGGGIYNQYCVSVNSNLKSAKILIHEFGHGFAGLADEYYNSSVAYSEFYPVDVEPWEPNITTLIDFESKWKHLLSKKTPIPTPDTEEYFNITGVFEGGGYAAKGIYRPSHDCLMNTFNGDHFCEACREAIQKMIDFYSY